MLTSIKNHFRYCRQILLRVLSGILSGRYRLPEGGLVVIAPHPDDEVLGCGGLIAHCTEVGRDINVIILTGGEASHKDCCSVGLGRVKKVRRKLAYDALFQLGLSPEKIINLDWQDGTIPGEGHPDFHSRQKELGDMLQLINPSTVLCPHPKEQWSDHIATAELTVSAIRDSPSRRELYYYCIWFWYSMPLRCGLSCNWKNSCTLDIRDVSRLKKKAIDRYLTPCAPCGKPWSGVLPSLLIDALTNRKELYFKASTAD